MLELAILGLLKERAMHGYQLRKRLADTLGSFWQVSYGSLYPTLKRLLKEGAVEMVFPKEQVGRRKNVYRITEQGEAMFADLLERAGQEASEDSGFRVRLAFFQYLKPETRIRLLERRRAFLEGRFSHLKESVQRLKEGIDSWTLSLMDHEITSTENDIRWLDDLIQAEQKQRRASVPATRRRTRARAHRLPKAPGLPQRSVSR